MSLVVLCDFDGTIMNIDTAVFTLEKFADPEWKVFDEQFERSEITLEQCLQKQFSTVRASEQEILEALEPAAKIRPGFEKLVYYCRTHGLQLVIVSAGMDFVIQHFLKRRGWNSSVEIYAPKAEATGNGVSFTFPKLLYENSANFKDDLVRCHKSKGSRVVFIADGFADYNAAKIADFAFAISESKLAELLKKNRIPHREIDDFREVVKMLEALASDTK